MKGIDFLYYLHPKQNENGSYSNFQSTPFRGAIELTEEQAETFSSYNGFVTIQRIEDEETGEIGTLVEPNMEAWEAWKAAQPEPEPAPVDMESLLMGTSIDHEIRLAQLELGL